MTNCNWTTVLDYWRVKEWTKGLSLKGIGCSVANRRFYSFIGRDLCLKIEMMKSNI